MDHTQELREHLVKLLTWGDAHVDFEKTVKDIPEQMMGKRPSSMPYSLWELLEHIRLAQRDILDFCRDSEYAAPAWPAGYWPDSETPPRREAWTQSVADFRSDRE